MRGFKTVFEMKLIRRSGPAILLLSALCVLSSCCSESNIPLAKKKLFSASARERNQGALDLASCGSRAKDAVPRLISLLYDENVGVQSSAAYALRKIDTPDAREALERATAARKRR